MRILILGAGALGSLLGARLSKTEAALELLTTNREHARAIATNGLTIEEGDGTLSRVRLSCAAEPAAIRPAPDLVLVTVKGYATQTAVAGVLDRCSPKTLFLTLQNGVGNWQRLAGQVGADRVLAGTTAQGATLLQPGFIRHGGNGATFLGEPAGPITERVEAIAALFRQAGLETRASSRIEQLIWEKLMVNVGINAITALTGIRNGAIAAVPAAQALSREAVGEAVAVAVAMGYPMPPEMADRVLGVARATAANRSSMGQDVDRRRRTEIENINGAIVQYGAETRIPTPVNRTLTQLVTILEATY